MFATKENSFVANKSSAISLFLLDKTKFRLTLLIFPFANKNEVFISKGTRDVVEILS
jgi:hypothetical protein